MFTATLKGTEITAVLQDLKDREFRTVQAGLAGLQAGLRIVMRIAQNEYLSGPRPACLGLMTGRLRASLVTNMQVQNGRVSGTLSTDVPYAEYHEHGFHGTVQVHQHTRVVGSTGVSKRKGLVTLGFVRAHRRQVDYDGRPFLKPALEKARPLILQEIQKALAAV